MLKYFHFSIELFGFRRRMVFSRNTDDEWFEFQLMIQDYSWIAQQGRQLGSAAGQATAENIHVTEKSSAESSRRSADQLSADCKAGTSNHQSNRNRKLEKGWKKHVIFVTDIGYFQVIF